MRKQIKKNLLSKALNIFLCILAASLWNGCGPEPIKESEEIKKVLTKKPIAKTPTIKPLNTPTIKPLKKNVFQSSLAGKWYSNDTDILKTQFEEFFKKVDIAPKNDITALILPHAGYKYSGQTAAVGLKVLGKEYKRIIVIGPSHRMYMEDILSIPRVTHYGTTLGEVPLDVELINDLLEYPMFKNLPHAHKDEHSVQIEVPLLQYAKKDFKLVPIVAGNCSLQTIKKVGAILKSHIGPETLVIASSDFTHYGPNYKYTPFEWNIPAQIKNLDMTAYGYIKKLDYEGFLKFRKESNATICGYIPIAILLSMLEKSTEVSLLDYKASGQLTNDFTNSVSYLATTFSGKWDTPPLEKPSKGDLDLSEKDKKQLLSLARQSIVYALKNRQVPQMSDLKLKLTDAMKQPRAAFVTLKKHELLRGCIGEIFPSRALYKSIIGNAINACANDNRFQPMTLAECDEIDIEISALTEPKPVEKPKDIKIGVDGIVLSKNGKSAVFLPQVALEQGWDLETTLNHLSKKADMPEDAWKEGASFLVFQAIVFGENEK